MAESKQKPFSLYVWLLKKLRKELIVWYFFTFLASFFYYQAVFGLKRWSLKQTTFPTPFFFKTVIIETRGGLLLYTFLCFFVGSLLTNLVCDYLKNYTLELCRKELRKLIINQSIKNPQKSQLFRREILNNFLGEVELFVPPFISIPQQIYAATVNITLMLIFVASFKESNFANL